MIRFQDFLDQLSRWGMEIFGKFYGPYRAKVENNDDPEFRGRIQISCPRARIVKGSTTWLLPMMQSAGSFQGEFWPPEVGSMVWIFFDNGEVSQPMSYLGGWYPKNNVHPTLKPSIGGPKRRGWTTPGGHKITLDDTKDGENIRIEHSSGKIVNVSKDRVSVGRGDGTFEPMMRGSTVKKWLENHTHGSSWGPTSAPIQPFPLDGLSDDTETS